VHGTHEPVISFAPGRDARTIAIFKIREGPFKAGYIVDNDQDGVVDFTPYR